ncbi:carbohydrate ABC transporter permease [Actinobacteria bacterium YIM 96077]|uniref:Carbohydrate ABC transporter permease n=1 Tax=Phytoactinopolyspora halophila TaxID=1981511 RepID=A0A329QZ73_9ACTN|nr:carbohydrate ABC transporter permease [Phytoactinopolyspora halophila]AYY13180.1 carbohydrate ABC transporter permease [Actinobacteria bacterium YIM 96077]RAW17581.1 carbohydrate ABC transporter permease [Phytoactinopolyspora halophila]
MAVAVSERSAPAARPAPRARRQRGGRAARNVGIAVALFFALAPIYWMLSTSFKPELEATQSDPSLLPNEYTMGNYQSLFNGAMPFGSFVVNSVITAAAAALISLVLSAFGGYALSKGNFRLREPMSFLILLTRMLPLVVLLGPLYLLLLNANLINTMLGLIIGYISFAVPFGVWLMKGFFDGVPKEVIEAARVDGYPRWQILLRVALPLTIPGLLTTATFIFIDVWNNIIYPLALINTIENQVLPSGLMLSFTGQFKTNWGGMMAASVLTSIPLLIAFFAIQRSMVRGLTAGAVAGE